MFEFTDFIFSFICGRARCFVIDGQLLPLCQRCMGLYGGAAATAVWLAACRLWRRGLPPASVIAADSLVLLAALLGGLGVLDFGPAWRLTCGAWTGHVVMFWIFTAGMWMWRAGKGRSFDSLRWRRADKAKALLVLPLLAILAMLLAAELPGPSWAWVAVALAGLVSLAAGVIWAIILTIVAIKRYVR
jgi:hypothetical protein